MPEIERGPETELMDIANFLLEKSDYLRKLEDEWLRALLFPNRVERQYWEILTERAQVIANLPQEIQSLNNKGIEIPQKVTDTIDYYSSLANEFLEKGDLFGMSSLLISRLGEPNDFELLAQKYS